MSKIGVFYISVKDINISEKGKSIKIALNGAKFSLEKNFCIISRDSYIPTEDEYLEVIKIREIQDKKGNTVPIISFQKHFHSYKNPTELYCGVCECGEVKRHNYMYSYVSLGDEKHLIEYRCNLCGYENKFSAEHDYIIIDNSYVCICGHKKEIEIPKLLEKLNRSLIENTLQRINKVKDRIKEIESKMYNDIKERIKILEKELKEVEKQEIVIESEFLNPIYVKYDFETDEIIYEKDVLITEEEYDRDEDGSIIDRKYNRYYWVRKRIKDIEKHIWPLETPLNEIKKWNRMKVRIFYKNKFKRINEIKEELNVLYKQFNELDKAKKELENKITDIIEEVFKDDTLKELWNKRKESYFHEIYWKYDPYNGYYQGDEITKKVFLKILKDLKGGDSMNNQINQLNEFNDISEIGDAIELGLPLENEQENKEVKELVKEENKKEVNIDFKEVIYEDKEKAQRYYIYTSSNSIEDDYEIYLITDNPVRYITEMIRNSFSKVGKIDIREDLIIIEEESMEWDYCAQSMKPKFIRWYARKI